MVERSLSMREVRGSIPRISIFLSLGFNGNSVTLREEDLIIASFFLFVK